MCAWSDLISKSIEIWHAKFIRLAYVLETQYRSRSNMRLYQGRRFQRQPTRYLYVKVTCTNIKALFPPWRLNIDIKALCTHQRLNTDIKALSTHWRHNTDIKALFTHFRLKTNIQALCTHQSLNTNIKQLCTHQRLNTDIEVVHLNEWSKGCFTEFQTFILYLSRPI